MKQERKYCIDCAYVRLPAKGSWIPVICNHPELLDLVTKKTQDCEWLRTEGHDCGTDAKYYEVPIETDKEKMQELRKAARKGWSKVEIEYSKI